MQKIKFNSLLPVASNITLSLSPNRSSGIPERQHFILILPLISLLTTLPLLLAKRLIDSITSRNTSFLRYLIPSDLHETAFVTAVGGRTCISSLCDSCVIYLEISRLLENTKNITYSLRILDSVVCGYPKSKTSSRSSYIMTKLSRIDSS